MKKRNIIITPTPTNKKSLRKKWSSAESSSGKRNDYHHHSSGNSNFYKTITFYCHVIFYILGNSLPLLPVQRLLPIAVIHRLEAVPGFYAKKSIEVFITPLIGLSFVLVYFGQVFSCTQQAYYKISTVSFFVSFSVFVIGLLIAVEGHGIHLAADAIHSAVSSTGGQEWNDGFVDSIRGYRLIYFLDETFSHHVWFCGGFISYLILIWIENVSFPVVVVVHSQSTSSILFRILSNLLFLWLSLLFGLFLFASYIEGQTVLFGYITSILTLSQIIILRIIRSITSSTEAIDPTAAIDTTLSSFLFISHVIGVALLYAWGSYYGGTYPEFRVLGLGPFSTWIPKLYTWSLPLSI